MATNESLQQPNVIYLGKKSRKEIKKYKKGVGAMYLEVQGILAKAKSQVPANEGVLPVVVIHRKKRKKGGFLSGAPRMFGS